MRVTVIVQARMGSSRFPGKVLAEIAGRPMLQHVVERAARIHAANEVVLATSDDPGNRPLLDLAARLGVPAYAGSESDVLDRYYQAAKRCGSDVIVRITADCPLLDPEVSSDVVRTFAGGEFDYVTNCLPPTYPDGLDTEVFSFAALERAWREASLESEREHVTPYIWKNPGKFRIRNVRGSRDLSHLRWTVDHADDLAFVRSIYARLEGRETTFGMDDVLRLLETEAGLADINRDHSRNEGYVQSVAHDAPAGKRGSSES